MRKWLIIMLLLSATPTFGQIAEAPYEEEAEPSRNRLLALQEKANQLLGTMQQLGDWDKHYESLVTAMDSMYERNGWDDESDLFSMEMAREIGAIPPWKPQERIGIFMEMVGDRYLLDEGQLASLRQRIFEVNVGIFSRNADRIMEYATEAIQTRAAGEPFTPEQIARWVELAEPVMLDARSSVHTAAELFMEELDPEQRELFEQDLRAGDRRMDDIQIMSVKWKRGEWSPRDWGMENDPIQRLGMTEEEIQQAAQAGETGGVARGEETGEDVTPLVLPETKPREEERQASEHAESQPDDAWARYVREFIRKYSLNEEQQQRCWLLYKDAKARDDVFNRRFERQTAALRGRAAGEENERVQANLKERIEKHEREQDRIFDQLKRRLDRLPTRAQRKAAATSRPATPTQATESVENAKP